MALQFFWINFNASCHLVYDTIDNKCVYGTPPTLQGCNFSRWDHIFCIQVLPWSLLVTSSFFIGDFLYLWYQLPALSKSSITKYPKINYLHLVYELFVAHTGVFFLDIVYFRIRQVLVKILGYQSKYWQYQLKYWLCQI